MRARRGCTFQATTQQRLRAAHLKSIVLHAAAATFFMCRKTNIMLLHLIIAFHQNEQKNAIEQW